MASRVVSWLCAGLVAVAAFTAGTSTTYAQGGRDGVVRGPCAYGNCVMPGRRDRFRDGPRLHRDQDYRPAQRTYRPRVRARDDYRVGPPRYREHEYRRERPRHWRRDWPRRYYGPRYYRPRYYEPYYDPYYYDPGPSIYVAPPRRYYRTERYSSAHVRWCYARYRSYREYDNTYQPYYGRRRQCYSPYD